MEGISIQVAKLEERVESLEDHRVRQNGSLQRLEDKVEEIWKAQADSKNLLIVTFLSVIGSIIVAIIGK
jgi:uncharacterized coiled-coil protein SlyX